MWLWVLCLALIIPYATVAWTLDSSGVSSLRVCLALVVCQVLVLRGARVIGDRYLLIATSSWVGFALLTLIFFWFIWLPNFSAVEGVVSYTGGDAGLIFSRALELPGDGWESNEGLNFKGILYYYATATILFGPSAISPLIANLILVLTATAMIVSVIYQGRWPRPQYRWLASLSLFLPSMAWFVTQSGKEVPSAMLLVIVTIAGAGALGLTSWSLSKFGLPVFFTAGIILGMIRPTALLISMVILLVFKILSFQSLKLKRLLIQISLVLGLFVPLIFATHVLGTLMNNSESNLSYLALAVGMSNDAIGVANEDSENSVTGGVANEESENSVTSMLSPNGIVDAIPKALIRTWGYILAPFPGDSEFGALLASNSPVGWGMVMAAISTLILIILAPLTFYPFFSVVLKGKPNPISLFFATAFWISMLGVAAGLPIVHERYRLLSLVWLVPAAVTALTNGASGRTYAKLLAGWLVISLAAILSYALLKTLT